VGRKTLRDGGQTPRRSQRMIEARKPDSPSKGRRERDGRQLKAARVAFLEVVEFVVTQSRQSERSVAGSVLTCCWVAMLSRMADGPRPLLASSVLPRGRREFMRAKIVTARFYADHILSKAPGLREASSRAARASPRWRSSVLMRF